MEAATERPWIAIVGSADPARAAELGLRDVEHASAACEALGRELAERRAGIIVYSGAGEFIEAAVVRGYAGSENAPDGSIQVRSPRGATGFAERDELFDPRPDPSPDWEVSFYRSLVETDGVLIVGGGRSTYVTGLVALAFEIPVLPVASFGGRAENIWEALDRVKNDAEPEEISRMGLQWRDELARPLVASLLAQRDRRVQRREAALRDARTDARRRVTSLVAGVVFLLLALGAIPLAYSTEPGTVSSLVVLLGAPLLAATAGAIMRQAFDQGRDWLRTAVLGMAAGAIASLLFIAAQLLTTPDVLQSADARRLLFFVVPVGFIGGLTFDDVYRRLRSADVTRTNVLQQ